jgi:hypothetical protein
MFLGVEGGWCIRLITLPQSMRRLYRQCEILDISDLYRPPWHVTGIALLVYIYWWFSYLQGNTPMGSHGQLREWLYCLSFYCRSIKITRYSHNLPQPVFNPEFSLASVHFPSHSCHAPAVPSLGTCRLRHRAWTSLLQLNAKIVGQGQSYRDLAFSDWWLWNPQLFSGMWRHTDQFNYAQICSKLLPLSSESTIKLEAIFHSRERMNCVLGNTTHFPHYSILKKGNIC